MAKESPSPLVRKELEKENRTGYSMTAEEAEQFGIITEKIIRARNQRELRRDEWDGLNYEEVYLANKRAAMSYLQPKKNDDEVRVNTGTTEKRIELVMNELLALNLEGEVRAFDKEDNLLQDVGEIFTDVVNRTKQIEYADDKNLHIYYELLTQPSVFVEELWVEKPHGRNRAERRLIQGVQMYLGDVNMPDTQWNEQPYLIKYARMGKDEARRLYRDLDPEKFDKLAPGAYNTPGGSSSTDLYRKSSLQDDEMESFIYMSYPDDEVQIYLQGVPMLDVGHKYTKMYGKLDGYHITMVSLKPLGGDWAYGKPLTQSAKTLQALDNETIRNLIRKFRQAIEPPMGVPQGKMFNRDIWNPGTITQGVKKDDFQKLVDHQGVTSSEFAMFDLMEKKTNEFIGAQATQPLEGGKRTATEQVLAQQQAVKLLGNSVLAVSRLEERLTMLRVKNILLNHTKPVGKEVNPITKKVQSVFARFSLADADINGQRGTRTIQFMGRGISKQEEFALFQAEQASLKQGKPIQLRTLNIPALKNLSLYFFVTVSSKPRESTELDKAMMTELINQGVAIQQITGIPMNPSKLVDKMERIYKEKGLFEKEAPQQAQPQQGQEEGLARTPGVQNLGQPKPQKPSVNSAIREPARP